MKKARCLVCLCLALLLFLPIAAALCATEVALEVVGHTVCHIPGTQDESDRTKVWGLAILADVEMPE